MRDSMSATSGRLAPLTMVVHGPTFGLLDTPVWFRCGEKNKLVRYRYALLVDAGTGRLDVLLWPLGDDGNCGFAELVLLGPDTIDEAELVVDPTEFNKLDAGLKSIANALSGTTVIVWGAKAYRIQ